jgi:hypothetical protein
MGGVQDKINSIDTDLKIKNPHEAKRPENRHVYSRDRFHIRSDYSGGDRELQGFQFSHALASYFGIGSSLFHVGNLKLS